MKLRVTEQSHPLTERLDERDTIAMIAALQAADRDLFWPSDVSASLADATFQANLATATARVQDCLAHPLGRVVIAGAGTSGRLALIAAQQCKHPRVEGLMAGGIDAFFHAKESVEDSPQAGVADLELLLAEDAPLVYIGISCGLSAAYVAGQLQRTLERANSYAILVGFNAAEDANQRTLPGNQVAMADLLQDMVASPDRGMLLNPIIGPEPITGSTRMKGGTATKIILDGLLGGNAIPLPQLRNLHDETYALLKQQVDLIDSVGNSLAKRGRLIYWTAGETALFTMLDASECPPTFGATPQQIWSYSDGVDALAGFDMTDFLHQDLANEMAEPVTVIATPDVDSKCLQVIEQWVDRQSRACLVQLKCPAHLWLSRVQNTTGLVQKWIFNAITTLGFARSGKIYGNRMIDLRISNVKLWDRAARIIAEIAGVTESAAENRMRQILLAHNVEIDNPNAVFSKARTLAVVPLAILLEKGCDTMEQASHVLEQEPRLSLALRKLTSEDWQK